MHATARAAIEKKIAAITADPLAWAVAHREEFLETLGSAGWNARKWSEAEYLAEAANELAHSKGLLAEAGEPEPEPAVDMERLMRANARARRAVEHLDS